MKWVSLILGFLFSSKPTKGINFKELAMEVYDETLARSRKPIGLILLGLASVILVCDGIFMSLVEATKQYDNKGFIYPNSTFLSGLILAAVVLLGYTYVFTRTWPGIKRLKARTQAAQEQMSNHAYSSESKNPPALDEAISLLIMDHIESRKQRRAHKKPEKFERTEKNSEGRSTSTAPHPPTGFA